MMRHLAIALAFALTATGAAAHDLDHGWSSAEECSPRQVRFHDEQAFMKKEIIEAGNLSSLKVSVQNAPVSVKGGGSGYTITVCKAADTAAGLNAIVVRLEGNELTAIGPDDGKWTVMYHLSVPQGANLDLTAKNGPLSLADVDGRVVARSHNGPVSLKNVAGTIETETHNGPVSISGGSGTMKVTASNGPLSVDLSGGAWNGTLDASTKNGPLSVKVPAAFASGVVVESRGRGPISCRAEGCERFLREDPDFERDEPRRIELGSGPVNVRLSTVNGPVTIKEQ